MFKSGWESQKEHVDAIRYCAIRQNLSLAVACCCGKCLPSGAGSDPRESGTEPESSVTIQPRIILKPKPECDCRF